MKLKKMFGLGKKHKNEIISDETAKEIGFTQEVLKIIRQVANNNIHPFNTNNYGELRTVGICLFTFEEQAEKLVIELQSLIKQQGYLAFICERSFSQGCKSRCRVVIIKGNDQFDILKIQQTNGDNYEISNEDVISKLREWNNRYPFSIVGADYDWIDANFIVLPTDKEMKSFAQEMYEFCPDIVEQGTGSIEKLIEEFKETKKLALWWD